MIPISYGVPASAHSSPKFRRAFQAVPERERARWPNDDTIAQDSEIVNHWQDLSHHCRLDARNATFTEVAFDNTGAYLPYVHIPPTKDSDYEAAGHSHPLRVLITAGIHGDEKASVEAAFTIAAQSTLAVTSGTPIDLRTLDLHVVPVVNPHGYRQNTRENRSGIDINRSFYDGKQTTPEAEALVEKILGTNTFDIAADHHEDFEATGPYCFEDVSSFTKKPRFSQAIIKALTEHRVEPQKITPEFDLIGDTDAAPFVHRYPPELPGAVLADAASEAHAFPEKSGMLLSTMLLTQGRAKQTLRIETGQRNPFADRVKHHHIIAQAYLQECGRKRPKTFAVFPELERQENLRNLHAAKQHKDASIKS